MAGPKTKEKLTKPGLSYKFEKALTKFSNKSTKAGAGFYAMGEYIARGMPRGASDKIISKYRKQADMIIKARKKSMAKYKFRATEKQKKKYYGS